MKKKIAVALCCVVGLITSITVLSNETTQTSFFENETDFTEAEIDFNFEFDFEFKPPKEQVEDFEFVEEENISEPFSIENVENVENVFKDVCALIKESDFETDEEMSIKKQFLSTTLTFGMNSLN